MVPLEYLSSRTTAMTTRYLKLFGAFCSVVVMSTSCGRKEPVPVLPAQVASPEGLAAIARLDADHALLALNKLIPGLGGFYFDSANVFTIRLKNTADREFAVATLRAYLGEWRRAQRLEDVLESGLFRIEPAAFEFTELHQWLRTHEGTLSNIDGVSSTDVDEAKGVVAVSVVSDEAQKAVVSLWHSLALPRDAIDVRIEPAIR